MTLKEGITKRLVASAVLIAQGICLTAPPVFAMDAAVKIAGETVINSRVVIGGMTAEQRAGIIQKNLDNALIATTDRSPSSVNITYIKGAPVITVGGYRIVEVDSGSAKAAGTTPALLAKKWADEIRRVIADEASIKSYVEQLTGEYASSGSTAMSIPTKEQKLPAPTTQQNSLDQQTIRQYRNSTTYRGRVVYAPAGLTIPIKLDTAISTQVAKPGDLIQATVSKNILIDESQIPAGSVVIGTVTDASGGKLLGRAASLTVKFNRIQTPAGDVTPLTAHLVGGIGRYTEGSANDDTLKGETWKTKAGQAVIRGAAGAGTGAALGTAVGAIAGGKRGVGKGAWSGTAIGATAGVAQSLILRKGKEVTIQSGTPMELQLDAPMTVAGAPIGVVQ